MTPCNSPTKRIPAEYPNTPFHCPATVFIKLKDMILYMRNIETEPILFNRRVPSFNIFHGQINHCYNFTITIDILQQK